MSCKQHVHTCGSNRGTLRTARGTTQPDLPDGPDASAGQGLPGTRKTIASFGQVANG